MAGVTPFGAAPGAGWHVDTQKAPRVKSLMYLSAVESQSDAAFTMALDYDHARLRGVHCFDAGPRRCAWPACAGAIKQGNRFLDEDIHRMFTNSDSKNPLAVEIYGPPGTVVIL